MKLELKTEKEHFLNNFSPFLIFVILTSIIILITNISLKLGIISRQYEINYSCSLLKIDKSSGSFEKLSKLLNIRNKQKIWDFCKEFTNN